MDKDRIEGKMEDVKGRVKRQAGEWTGDKELQSEGAADQVKGKAQNVAGKIKDAGRDAVDKLKQRHDDRNKDEEAA
jgi:uncharacterized protein YjbJ (UPF0337 family)